MPATYDPALSTDKDWVRFLVGDTVTATASLDDDEIIAVLASQTATGEARKYFAAAEILQALLTRWTTSGKGVVEKQVQGLRIRIGIDGTSSLAVQQRINDLRRRGARLLAPRPFHLKHLAKRTGLP